VNDWPDGSKTLSLGTIEAAALAAQSVQILNPDSPAALLLICEHAGREVPQPWRSLGFPDALLNSHFGCDLGADALTRELAGALSAPAILARYSRLFLDYNRFPHEWDCMRPDAGGIPIPGNLGIDGEQKDLREAIARKPVESAIEQLIGGRQAVIAIHTFTPVFNGFQRPWDVGVLWRDDKRFAHALLQALRVASPHAALGDNEPYDLHGVDAFTLKRHVLSRGLPCIALEIRNDLLGDPASVAAMSSAIARAVKDAAAAVLSPPT
jgi:predicted N-formylglutamate amidohydrolase